MTTYRIDGDGYIVPVPAPGLGGTVITSGAATITPTIVMSIPSARQSQSIVHVILDRTSPDVTLRPALLRSGTLELGFAGATGEFDSKTAVDTLSTAATFSLVSTDRPTMQMTFVVTGEIAQALEDQSRDAWVVTVGYQEVAP